MELETMLSDVKALTADWKACSSLFVSCLGGDAPGAVERACYLCSCRRGGSRFWWTVQDVCWLHFNSRVLHLVLGKHALLLHKASLLTASRPAGSDVGN